MSQKVLILNLKVNKYFPIFYCKENINNINDAKDFISNNFKKARKLIGSSKALEDTLKKTIDLINDEIIKLGGNIVDFKV